MGLRAATGPGVVNWGLCSCPRPWEAEAVLGIVQALGNVCQVQKWTEERAPKLERAWLTRRWCQDRRKEKSKPKTSPQPLGRWEGESPCEEAGTHKMKKSSKEEKPRRPARSRE